jgi:MraZ protein
LSFTGRYERTIDSKSRLIIPSRLRDELEEDRVVLVVGPDGCIEMWSGEHWRAYERRLLEQRRSDAGNRAAIRTIAASAHTDQIDRQGRMTVPAHLKSFAGIERDVVVVGNFDHCEVWNPERYEDAQAGAGEGLTLSDLVRGLDL